jgi:hypothetical protein
MIPLPFTPIVALQPFLCFGKALMEMIWIPWGLSFVPKVLSFLRDESADCISCHPLQGVYF